MEANAGGNRPPRKPHDVFLDMKGRRAAILNALTTDVERLYQQCDPEKENLRLYGYPNEEWRVRPPKDIPAIVPEPVLANFLGAMAGFGKSERRYVFSMINTLPTITDVVSGTRKKENPSSSNQGRRKSYPQPKRQRAMIGSKKEDRDNICGACGDLYVLDEFWICCDSCDKWYHGECVKITQELAELVELYQCPFCSNQIVPR